MKIFWRKKLFLLLLTALFLCVGAQASAGTINVPSDQSTIQAAIAAAVAGDIIQVAAGTYNEIGQIVIDKNLTITGADKSTTIIKTNFNSIGGAYATTSPWIYVQPGVSLDLSKVTLDGDGKLLTHAIASRGEAHITDCNIKNIINGKYDGRGISFHAGTTNTVTNCNFTNIGRIGIHVRGTVTGVTYPPLPMATISGCTYVGKGDGDWLDYAVEFGGGGTGTVTGCTITNCTGVASSDGSGSAGVLVTDYYGNGTAAEITGCFINHNAVGIYIGYDDDDESTVAATGNDLTGNTDNGIFTMSDTVNLTESGNTWGGFGVSSNDETSAVFSDDYGSDKVITANGNVYHENPFGADSAIAFDGTGDYLSLVGSPDWNFGTEDFTIDMWVNFQIQPTATQGILGAYNQGLNGYYLYCNAADGFGLHVKNNGVWSIITSHVPALAGQWHHLAIVGDGGTVSLLVDGVATGSFTAPVNSAGTGLVIGRLTTNLNNYYFNGHMDEVRIVKDLARTFDSGDLPNDPSEDIVTLTILQTSDLHHHASGYGPYLDYSADGLENDDVVGGYARLATLINDVRTKVGAANTLLVDSGDFTMGTPYDLSSGVYDISLNFFQQMDYDAITLGNHEFDWTPDGTYAIINYGVTNGFSVPVVASNMVTGGHVGLNALITAEKIVPEKVIELPSGLKVGILGLLGPGANRDAPSAPPVTFGHTYDDQTGNYSWDYSSIQAKVDELKNVGAYAADTDEPVDMVVVLSHSGVSGDYSDGDDIDLAKNVTGIDIIASGHAHTATNDKIVVPNTATPAWETLIFSPGEYGEALSRLDLTFDLTNGKIDTADFTLIPVDDTIEGDAFIRGLLETETTGYNDKISTGLAALEGVELDTPVTHTGFPLDMSVSNPATRMTNLGSLCADAVRATANDYAGTGDNAVTPFDLAVVAKGVIRDDILPGKTGVIPFSDIYSVLPLGASPWAPPVGANLPGYPLMSVYLYGADIYKICELGLSASLNPAYGSFYLNFSGLQIGYDVTGAATFSGVKSLSLYQPADTFCQGSAGGFLDPVPVLPATLYHGVVDLYALQLMNVANGLLPPGVDDIVPMDAEGNPLVNLAAARIDDDDVTSGIQELKEWEALWEFVDAEFPNAGDPIDPAIYGPAGSIYNRIAAPVAPVTADLWVRSDIKAAGDPIVDTTGNHPDLTALGNADHETPFGVDSALVFDGSGDYLSLGNHADWNFASNDFTIDMWVNFEIQPTATQGILGAYNQGLNGYYLYCN
ncbi:MAG: DUF1565 domain-containing protein, partial [Desulfobacteraceae bacterium]